MVYLQRFISIVRKVVPQDARGLQSLQETVGKYKPFRGWIVYQGESRQKFDRGVFAIPFREALGELANSTI